jgi:hypothetical protein
MDQDGSILKKGKDEEVNVEKLPAGEYFVEYIGKRESFQVLECNEARPKVKITKKTIELPRMMDFEIYDERGKLVGNGTSNLLFIRRLGLQHDHLYFLNLNGHFFSFRT